MSTPTKSQVVSLLKVGRFAEDDIQALADEALWDQLTKVVTLLLGISFFIEIKLPSGSIVKYDWDHNAEAWQQVI